MYEEEKKHREAESQRLAELQIAMNNLEKLLAEERAAKKLEEEIRAKQARYVWLPWPWGVESDLLNYRKF